MPSGLHLIIVCLQNCYQLQLQGVQGGVVCVFSLLEPSLLSVCCSSTKGMIFWTRD